MRAERLTHANDYKVKEMSYFTKNSNNLR